jgi:rod shape-determining protein MreC
MAPPSNRRPGFSRRAQYGLFFGYVVAVAGILFALLLLAISIMDPLGFSTLKGAMLDVTSPVSSAGRSMVGGIGGLVGSVGDYFRAGSQNAQLRSELGNARRQLLRARSTELENQRLRRLLEVSEQASDKVVSARIVSSSFDSPRRLAVLSAGSNAGVRPGQPVRSADGLIGRVLETGRFASRILLVSDGTSVVPVVSARDGTAALATGRGDGTLDLKTQIAGANPFRRGDVLVTSGTGGVFPPSIPVAIVVRVKGDETVARPIADPASLDYAIVETVYQPAAAPGQGKTPPPL